ncbi:hypothetical protein B0T26DRAFT_1413 [Lasiosphaeria miniovina]|uniref:Uncharacterized protein n=1 Tax=Lasiosphaeria miniovina TaxID=1954250 RepID=A0AA40BEU7_9PEZI|nr:uncharacterized protein B0T26DRAFT_1413 [Lasiosphaeria miniovina]KAK0732959.1 hypothetical protein B0T26DRAFT_1413 [Lasiosphaeria miniovina]
MHFEVLGSLFIGLVQGYTSRPGFFSALHHGISWLDATILDDFFWSFTFGAVGYRPPCPGYPLGFWKLRKDARVELLSQDKIANTLIKSRSTHRTLGQSSGVLGDLDPRV